jgi:ABC-2 type transport system permease protein
MNSLRVFFRGGVTSYRALFGWLNPWVGIPMLVIAPLFQLLFFAYLGRATDVASDTYFVVGNALLAASLPGINGVGGTVSGERYAKTLGILLASPANRLALFLGRTLPAVATGFAVSALCLVSGALLLDVHVAGSAVPGLLLVIVVSAFSCSALGLCTGSVGLRVRDVIAVSWIFQPVLLLVSGANVPRDRLPDWLQAIGSGLPLTHGIEAARDLVAGQTLAESGRPLLLELMIGLAYAVAGVLLLRFFEFESRRTASLETM